MCWIGKQQPRWIKFYRILAMRKLGMKYEDIANVINFSYKSISETITWGKRYLLGETFDHRYRKIPKESKKKKEKQVSKHTYEFYLKIESLISKGYTRSQIANAFLLTKGIICGIIFRFRVAQKKANVKRTSLDEQKDCPQSY